MVRIGKSLLTSLFTFSSLAYDLTHKLRDRIQLLRERLSERATIPKGIVGGFEFAVLHRNLKEWHERPWTYVWEC